MARPGPPRKDTETRRKIIVEALTRGLTFNLACDYAGIDRNTGYNWMKADREFFAQVQAARSLAVEELVEICKKKEPWKILKNVAKGEFKDVVEQKQEMQIVEKPMSPSDMIATAMKASSMEIARLEKKAQTGLTTEEHRSLLALSKSIIELSEEERRIRGDSDLSTLSDEELLIRAEEAMKVLRGTSTDRDQEAN